jgi:hypothetical protein
MSLRSIKNIELLNKMKQAVLFQIKRESENPEKVKDLSKDLEEVDLRILELNSKGRNFAEDI